ncbi:DUF5665 domain-containing protein [Paenibacillus campinasensis]|uniref:DUF5665 domain-containing protein n=1 Tax=Paenibacillus campinasensis TaxID=66347 RepID=UPI001E2B1969|nr:DUF5665 domain-containing protein [Paenibacillus campinasensis]
MSKVNPYPGHSAPSDHGMKRDDSRSRQLRSREHTGSDTEQDQRKLDEREAQLNEHPFELRHEVRRLNTRLDSIAETLEKSQMKDMIENYMNPKKRIIANLTAGLARGLGLTLGTALVLGLLGYFLSLFVDMPMIGDFISDLQGYVQQSR